MMKNGEVIELYETLKRISEDKEIKFNVVVGYILAKNKEILRQEAVLIYKMRQDIIMEHGIVDGKDIIVDKKYIDEVNQKINELMEINTDIILTKIPIEALEDINLNLKDIENLLPLINNEQITSIAHTTTTSGPL